MIKAFENDTLYVLHTCDTTYAFKVLDNGLVEHLYYGKRVRIESSDALCQKSAFIPGNMVAYDNDIKGISKEYFSSEISSLGKGDTGEVAIINTYEDGSMTSDFLYTGAVFYSNLKTRNPYTLPLAHKPDDELVVTYKDRDRDVKLEITYSVFYEANVIARRMKIINREKKLIIKRAMSLELNLPQDDYELISFSGAWAREMSFNRQAVSGAGLTISSNCGFSSNRYNPFFMISKKNTDEHHGEAYGFNLIYSGNHYENISSRYEGVRVLSGINPMNFSYELGMNETFDVPQAIMTYSDLGFNGISANMHNFVNHHITPEGFACKTRKILLNSWEASYFKFNEASLLRMAKSASELGIELFVLDDGWFGKRDDDKSSLGDWDYNKKKLPHGLFGLAKKINKLGMGFGLWVEPEMVNVNSRLYKEHPDWCVDIKGRHHSEGRNQRFLDLTKQSVRDYIVDKICSVLRSANIEYVKWDMNRIFSDTYSDSLKNQEEFNHRYILGLYAILERITKEFPDVLFEGCASGGNRFDLGVLKYFPQIWASDNTDAWCRAGIQNSYSYGYPIQVVSAHVSGVPNHQTLRNTPLTTRFNVAMYGRLGYECNIADLSKEDKKEIKEQIEFYKKYRDVISSGDFYRINSPCTGTINYDRDMEYAWLVISKDKSVALLMTIHDKAVPNNADARVKTYYLDDSKLYNFTSVAKKINIKNFGDLINAVTPIHIKPDSMLHNTLSKVIHMDCEKEDYTVYGSVMNECGIKLHDNYASVGFDDHVRYYQDYSSRLYIITEKKS